MKAEALEIFGKLYEQWENNPSRMENGYQYEATFGTLMKEVSKEIFQASLGKIPKSKNEKKSSNQIWKIKRSKKS
jgi:hypothetical protein